MNKQTANGKRFVYEEILHKKFGALQRLKTKPSVSPKPSSSHRTATPPRKTPMQDSQKSWKEASPLSGSMSVEQRAMIERIFEHYAGDEQTHGSSHLRFNKFRKMIHESKLPIDQTTAELVFYGENRHQYERVTSPYMHLDVFLRMLPKLSQEIHPEEFDMLSGLHSMLSEYFEPLYKSIMKKTFFEVARRLSTRRLDDFEHQTLSDNQSRLKEVYLFFFTREIDSQLDNPHISEQLVFEQFVELNRSLGIVPKFIEKGPLSSPRHRDQLVERNPHEAGQRHLRADEDHRGERHGLLLQLESLPPVHLESGSSRKRHGRTQQQSEAQTESLWLHTGLYTRCFRSEQSR